MNCIQEQGELAPYWINTSDNQLIKDLLTHSSESFRTQFEDLLAGKTIEKLIDENMVFGDLKKNEIAAWSLLLMAGYLKVTRQWRRRPGIMVYFDYSESRSAKFIPANYRAMVIKWTWSGMVQSIFKSFTDRKSPAFEADFRHLVEETFSVHDTSKDPEAFYHGFMVGATASLYHNKNYEIKSNRESGYGRYDYMIFSHDIIKADDIDGNQAR